MIENIKREAERLSFFDGEMLHSYGQKLKARITRK